MRTLASTLAIALPLAIASVGPSRAAPGETIVMEGDAGGMLDSGGALMEEPGACGCRSVQSPPWHGNVAGDPCGPSCPPPTMFHANPCGQLWQKHHARQQGLVPPPSFPRLHGWLADGWWPTPRPIMLPRCPNCGAHIEHGM